MAAKKRLLKFIFFWITLSLIFILGALLLVLKAYGYKINFPAGKIQKTSILFIKSDPKDAEVKINGKLVTQKTPYRLDQVLPGKYYVEVNKEGYLTWQTTVEIAPGWVSEFDKIVLFLKEPKISQLQAENEKKLLDLEVKNEGPKVIEIKGSELWVEDQLVTRFSDNLISAKWYPDENHILVLQKNQQSEIKILELDGQNITRLVLAEDISKFAITDLGRRLIYQDGQNFLEAKIR